MLSNSFKWKHFVGEIIGSVAKKVLLQKIWLFYKTSEKHHKWVSSLNFMDTIPGEL